MDFEETAAWFLHTFICGKVPGSPDRESCVFPCELMNDSFSSVVMQKTQIDEYRLLYEYSTAMNKDIEEIILESLEDIKDENETLIFMEDPPKVMELVYHFAQISELLEFTERGDTSQRGNLMQLFEGVKPDKQLLEIFFELVSNGRSASEVSWDDIMFFKAEQTKRGFGHGNSLRNNASNIKHSKAISPGSPSIEMMQYENIDSVIETHEGGATKQDDNSTSSYAGEFGPTKRVPEYGGAVYDGEDSYDDESEDFPMDPLSLTTKISSRIKPEYTARASTIDVIREMQGNSSDDDDESARRTNFEDFFFEAEIVSKLNLFADDHE